MTVDRNQRLQDYLDGALSPAAEAEVKRLLEESREARASLEQMRQLMTLLSTPLDLDPPVNLTTSIMNAVRADVARRAQARRLPALVEKALVVAGVATLAGIVVSGQAVEPAGWLGRLAVLSTQSVDSIKEVLVRMSGSLAHYDWVANLFGTLSSVGQTVLVSAAQPLMTLSLVSVMSAALVVFVLLRGERMAREGGLRNVSLLG